ncbi:hypothetical protein [Rhodopirellula sp. MGV]|uniref:hypothetical protein n=1 Tax=Rhodopirellula sp. MGV TaxID=2023130 RepID=UPI000B973003|nr:hypothetical protein [Rhodopirellula sp. MGV]PNY37678.1 hypothetical protein C2E31_06950 [Rhodopirellula baltica]
MDSVKNGRWKPVGGMRQLIKSWVKADRWHPNGRFLATDLFNFLDGFGLRLLNVCRQNNQDVASRDSAAC